jgi:hypothetical protein
MSKKYHEQHPTISFRCRSIDEYNMIKRMVQISGKSESTFIREILLKQEPKESKSYNEGCERAINKFILPCSICKQPMVFSIENYVELRQTIVEMFGNYAHVECNQKKQQQGY